LLTFIHKEGEKVARITVKERNKKKTNYPYSIKVNNLVNKEQDHLSQDIKKFDCSNEEYK
jgi:hypothetical protein